ncbi:MAG: phage tail protein [Fibrobacter sp.]|nr:phage tail protein [Fibrobacter sp.]
MSDLSLPVAFHFSVSILGSDFEASFQEVSGIDSTVETEPVQGGGDNHSIYYLPKKVTHSDLVLKRALVTKTSAFYIWCQSVMGDFGSFRIVPLNLSVKLLDEKHDPLCAWSIGNAYPVKWVLGNLDAMKNEVLIEEIHFKYSTVSKDLICQ